MKRMIQFIGTLSILIIVSMVKVNGAVSEDTPIQLTNEEETNEEQTEENQEVDSQDSIANDQDDKSTQVDTSIDSQENQTEVSEDSQETDTDTSSLEASDGEDEQISQDTDDSYTGSPDTPDTWQDYILAAQSSEIMPVDVMIEDQYVQEDLLDVLLIHNKIYVSLSDFAALWGLDSVTWNQANYKATMSLGETLDVNYYLNDTYVLEGDQAVTMDVPALLVDGKFMVPLRFVANEMGINVGWNSKYETVVLASDVRTPSQDFLETRFYTYSELQIFSKLVMKEAGSVSYEAKHGVASVVMNHVYSEYYGNTVYDAIYDDNGNEQFPPAHKALFYKTVPNYDSVRAVKMVLRGENSVGTCLYFNTRPFRGKTVYKVVDGVYFCY